MLDDQEQRTKVFSEDGEKANPRAGTIALSKIRLRALPACWNLAHPLPRGFCCMRTQRGAGPAPSLPQPKEGWITESQRVHF